MYKSGPHSLPRSCLYGKPDKEKSFYQTICSFFKNMFPILSTIQMDQFMHSNVQFITKPEIRRAFHKDLCLDVFSLLIGLLRL